MATIHYKDHDVTLIHGTAWETAQHLNDNTVDCIVTSPPYWKQRNYADNPKQWGQQPTIGHYITDLTDMFSLMRRKLKDTGVMWLNLGDKRLDGQLCGIPWLVAKDLQEDGWHLRSAVVWDKPNGMPESVTNRVSENYEMVFMLTKTEKHYFNLDPIRVQYDGDRAPSRRARPRAGNKANSLKPGWTGDHNGRNPGSVWSIPTQPSPLQHEAMMPYTLAKRCIESSCPPNGLVADPFHGTGTTGQVAVETGRRYVGGDINAEYLDISLKTKLQTTTIPF